MTLNFYILLQVRLYVLLLRRLMRVIVKRIFPLPLSKGSGGRNQDISGDILTTQLIDIPKVYLVASPGFKRDISTSTTLNTTNRRKILLNTIVGTFIVVLLAQSRILVSIIVIIVLSPLKIVFAFIAISGGQCPKDLLIIRLSTHDIYQFNQVRLGDFALAEVFFNYSTFTIYIIAALDPITIAASRLLRLGVHLSLLKRPAFWFLIILIREKQSINLSGEEQIGLSLLNH